MFTLPAGRGISAGKEEFKGLFAQNEAGINKKSLKREEEMKVKMNSRIACLALVALLMFLAARPAAAQQVTYNFMPGVNFSNFHTYKWVEIRAEFIQIRSSIRKSSKR
jgi:hypothetical protein